jgi:protein involved in polysaccharide export with SLBB domain
MESVRTPANALKGFFVRRLQHRTRPLRWVVFLSLTLLFGPAACSTSRKAEPDILQDESWQVSEGQELPSLPASQTSDYRIGAGDLMNILVYGEPDLTTIARVGGEGFIELPLVGQVQAAGLTLPELKQSIEEKLRKGYLVKPDVQIILQEYKQDVVHLLGQVATPGPYRITHSNTLLDTISKAGGFTPIAKRNKVKIIRKENGKSIVFFVDTTRITEEGNLQDDVLLMPGDVIIVPERFF